MTLHLADRAHIYAQLTTDKRSLPRRQLRKNHEWLACIVASWCVANSVLPDYLGLECHDFVALKKHYFTDYALPEYAPSGKQLDFNRMLERQDLINLLRHYANPSIETDWIIGLLVAGCLGNDHLWHDMGLWSRSQLTALLNYNFPALAAKNIHDMKWKKFLYKQLCEAECLYLCRAPSCQVCADYGQCYGSEESVIDTLPITNDNDSHVEK
jgi:nitrogen fixation protein NifQ